MPAPVAAFTATPLTGELPLRVVFTDLSTNTPTAWLWDFGDGNTTTEQSPAHPYTAAGVYTVTLTASNGTGSDGETKAGYVTVTAPVDVAPVGQQVTEISRLYLGRGLRGEPFNETGEQIELSVDLQDLGAELDEAVDYLGHHLSGPLTDIPTAALVPIGTLYAADDGTVYQSDGTVWTPWTTGGGGGGPAADTAVWMPLFDSDGAVVFDSTGVIPTLIPLG